MKRRLTPVGDVITNGIISLNVSVIAPFHILKCSLCSMIQVERKKKAFCRWKVKVLLDLRVAQAKTRWPGKLIKKSCETNHMDWKQRGRRDSPAFHGDKCAATTLTETKCEQICTRKREITFAHLNPPVSSPLPKKALRFCMTTCKRNICVYMYTERKVEGGEGGGEKSKRRSGKEIYNSGETFAALPEQKQQQ